MRGKTVETPACRLSQPDRSYQVAGRVGVPWSIDLLEEVETRLLQAFDAGLEDLLWADAVLFGTPENFGYMSGALKDFFDRTYEAAKERTIGLPYATFISAGNDGTGAEYNIDRIARGYSMKRVSDSLIVRGELTDSDLQQAYELGQTVAAALDLGIF